MGLFDIFKKKDDIVPSVPGPAVAPVTFEGYEGSSFELLVEDVADVLGISQSYISRLEKKIIKKLIKENYHFAIDLSSASNIRKKDENSLYLVDMLFVSNANNLSLIRICCVINSNCRL